MSIQIAEEYFKAVTNMLLTSNSYEPNGLTEWWITRSGSIGPKRPWYSYGNNFCCCCESTQSSLTSSIHERLQYLPYYNRNVYKIINTINEDVKCSDTRLVAQAASKHYLQHIYLSYERWYLHHAPHSPISLYMVSICLLIVVLREAFGPSCLQNCLKSWRV